MGQKTIDRNLKVATIEMEPKKAKAAKKKLSEGFEQFEKNYTMPFINESINKKSEEEDKQRLLDKINKLKTGTDDN